MLAHRETPVQQHLLAEMRVYMQDDNHVEQHGRPGSMRCADGAHLRKYASSGPVPGTRCPSSTSSLDLNTARPDLPHARFLPIGLAHPITGQERMMKAGQRC